MAVCITCGKPCNNKQCRECYTKKKYGLARARANKRYKGKDV